MKYFFLAALLFPTVAFSQTIVGCPTPVISYDFNCGDDSIMLVAAAGYDDYLWAPPAGLSDPTIFNPMALVSGTSYTLSTTSVGSNLIFNGDFSLGNIGFISGQIYSATYSPCNYYVNSGFFSLPDPTLIDHTPTTDGMFMSIDGCSPATVIWEQTIPSILINTTYKFSFWATRADYIQPIFEIHFIGDVTGDNIVATQVDIPYTGVWTWDEYGIPTWNSGLNSSLTIRIVNLETNNAGVDFAMDDFSLNTSCTSTVTVDLPSPTSGNKNDLIPNIFTPNNDGQNDKFRFGDLIVKNCKIYDRWGILIKEMSEQDAEWDGKNNNGDICSDGVYFYILSGADKCGGEISKNGFVHLLK